MKKIDVGSIDFQDLLQGSTDYVQNEKRDSIYKVATFLVKHFWYKPTDIADGIGVLLSQIGFYANESRLADTPFHLAKVSLGWNISAVSAYAAKVRVPPQSLHQILHVGDLLQHPEQQSPQIPLWIIHHWPAWTILMKAKPQDGADRS